MNHWINIAAGWLTPRRIRAHAFILAFCLWGVCVIDYATPGLFDRAGNIKFQDFLQFPISARLIAEGRADQLYDDQVLAEQIRKIASNTSVELKYFYGPQVSVPFVPFVRLPFLIQAGIWVAVSLLIYFACVYVISKLCPSLDRRLVVLCAIAYPPLFHFFMRGQLSALPLLFFTGAYLALRTQREWLAGIALGFLAFKPQFLVAIPLILLFAHAWRILIGLVLSATAQLALTYIYFGKAVMARYVTMLFHSAGHPGSTELRLSSIQMHSLYSFWGLLLHWPRGVWIAYVLSVIFVIALTTTIWKSASSAALRYSGLLLAAVLVNPHIYIYDLLALAPMFLLLANWSIENPHHPETPAMRILLYMAFLLPLFGPLARWTHVQLSVVVFVVLLWTLHRTAVPSALSRLSLRPRR